MSTERYASPGIVCTDHTISVPLDHAAPEGERIEIFAREVVAADRAGLAQPTVLWLQGGPGGKAVRPVPSPSWLTAALRTYRVILMDQRGTGRSTPANRQTLAGMDARAQADYLAHFRADAIVRDAEFLRYALCDGEPWTLLGQSFGGFCALTYLSIAPEGLAQVMITGGLPSLTATAEEVYRAAYPRVVAKNDEFYGRYPGDVERARAVVNHLREHEEYLPTGERLSVRRFQGMGITFGMASSFDSLHYLLEEAFVAGPMGPVLSDTFLRGVEGALNFAGRPLYAVLHEPIYAQNAASGWAAEKVYRELAEFSPDADGAFLLTGEMIYPFLFEEDPALVPLAGAAQVLAERADWPALYDLDVLADNTVPVVAAVYHGDMYVDRDHSLATAAQVRNVRTWVTSEYEHDGVRQGAGVFSRLQAMLAGMV